MPAKRNEDSSETPLTKREQQLMEILFRKPGSTARQTMEELPDAPGYSTVRTLLMLLVKKGHLSCTMMDRALVYRPVRRKPAAAASALRRLVRTFFDGSIANAVTGLLSLRDTRLSAEEIRRLEELIARNKKEAP